MEMGNLLGYEDLIVVHQYRYDPERGYNTWIQNYSSSAYVADNISDNTTWQVTDNTSMIFNWVNDNGTSYDNIFILP